MENKFPETLRFLLQQRGITYAILAEAIGVTKQAISQYTNGKTTPNYPMLIKIASYFGVSLDYLITGQNPENKILSKELGLSEGALQMLKKFAFERYRPYLDRIISDPKFFDTFSDAIHDLEISAPFYPFIKWQMEQMGIVKQIGEDADREQYMNIVESKSAEKLNVYFREFFKSENVMRMNKNSDAVKLETMPAPVQSMIESQPQ